MTKTRVYLKDFLYSLYYFVLMYGVIVFISHIILRIDRLYEPLLMIIPFFIGFIISMEASNFYVFIGLNLLMMFSFLLIPMEFLSKVQTMVFAFLITLFWIVDRINSNPAARNVNQLNYFGHGTAVTKAKQIIYKKNTDDKGNGNIRTLNISHIATGYALNLGLVLLGGPIFTVQKDLVMADTVKNIFVAMSIVMLVITILQIHLSNLDFSLSLAVNTNITSLKKIARFNNTVVIGFAAIVATIAILAVMLHAENAIIYIGYLVMGGIMFIAGNLSGIDMPDLFTEFNTPRAGNNILPQSNKTSLVWQMFDNIVTPIAIITVTAVIIAALCFAAYTIYKKFYIEKPGDDIKEFLKPDVHFSKIRLSQIFSSLTVSWTADNNSKIRKLFYKKIMAHIKNGTHIRDAYTPHEIAQTVKKREDISDLVKIYSKARYSNETISDTDAAQILKQSNSFTR